MALQVLLQPYSARRTTRAADLQPHFALQQRLPDGFGLGFMRQTSYLAGQTLHVRILDVESHGRNPLFVYHSTKQNGKEYSFPGRPERVTK
jgi:hypothetical protein